MIFEDECRALWSAVLWEGWRNAHGVGYGMTPGESERAQAWLRSPDFREVCDLAGVYPQAVMAVWKSGDPEARRQFLLTGEGSPKPRMPTVHKLGRQA